MDKLCAKRPSPVAFVPTGTGTFLQNMNIGDSEEPLGVSSNLYKPNLCWDRLLIISSGSV